MSFVQEGYIHQNITLFSLGKYLICLISGFRREVAENCVLMGYYAASSGNFLPTFRDNISVPSSGGQVLWVKEFLNPEEGTNTLSRNVGNKLPVLAA